MNILHLTIFLLTSIWCSSAQLKVASYDDLSGAKPAKKIVEVGAFTTDLYNFNYAEHSFEIIFYMWWDSKDKDYDPTKIVEVTNATTYDYKVSSRAKKGDVYVSSARYYAKIHHRWDMTNFPFEHQTLEVHLEDGFSDINTVEFVPDIKHSNVASELELSGWTLRNFSIKEAPYSYSTDFGDHRNVEKSSFSRITLLFDIKRHGLRNFFNYFIGFFMAVFLASVGYFISPNSLDAKLALILSAVFAVTGNKYVLDTTLPISPNFTLADSIELASFFYIFLSVFINALESVLVRHDKIHLCRPMNLIALIGGLSAYLVFIGIHITAALGA